MSKHISVFYNLTSGKANFTKQLSKIENILIELNYTYDFYNYLELKDKIKGIFMTLKKEGKRRILICGGDGTYHYFVNDLMKHNVNDFFELSLFPLGTSNDLASFYKFSKKLKKFKKQIDSYTPRVVDAYKINDEYYIYAAAVGKFSLASYGVKRKYVRRFGYLAYMLAALKDLFKKKKYYYKLKFKNQEINGRTNLIVFAGINRVASVKFTKKLGIKPDDGFVNAIVFERKSFLSWINIILFYLFFGKVRIRVKNYEFDQGTLEISPNDMWNVDGEGKKYISPLKITTIPQAIIINVPNNKQ